MANLPHNVAMATQIIDPSVPPPIITATPEISKAYLELIRLQIEEKRAAVGAASVDNELRQLQLEDLLRQKTEREAKRNAELKIREQNAEETKQKWAREERHIKNCRHFDQRTGTRLNGFVFFPDPKTGKQEVSLTCTRCELNIRGSYEELHAQFGDAMPDRARLGYASIGID